MQGFWWLPTAADAEAAIAGQHGDPGLAAAAVAREGGIGGTELLKLAAKQRMNTETRRSIFCVIMGSDDCVDASERLLRLPLKVGKLSSHKYN